MAATNRTEATRSGTVPRITTPTVFVPVTNPPSVIQIRFRQRLAADDYAAAVLACQQALTMAGFADLATVWPDDSATDEQINEVADRWSAASPWSS